MDLLVRLAADGALIGILAVASVVILNWLRTETWTRVPVLVMAGLTALLAGKVMSLLYQPAVARPFLELGLEPGAAYVDNPGFPSDHALLASAAILAVHMATRNRPLLIALVIIGAAMCAARVAALVHTPLDVIFGATAGLAGWFWYRKLTKQ